MLGVLNAGYKGNGQRAWKQSLRPGCSLSYFLYDGDTVVCELNSSGLPTYAYGYGPLGLVQRYNTANVSPASTYMTYSFDPWGNLTGRHRQSAQAGEDSYAASTTAYDVMGYLILDASTNSGLPFLFTDPIGGQGQQGVYTDYETRPNASATGLALVAQSYYDASLARMLTRSGGGLNEYEAATLPYRVFSNIGKGILNSSIGILADTVEFSARFTPEALLSGRVPRIPERLRHPFQTGSRPEERAANIFGEFVPHAASAFFGATGAVKAAAGAARAVTGGHWTTIYRTVSNS